MRIELEDAVEIVRGAAADAPALLTCEHASERLPEPWRWPAEDRWLLGTHWAYDPGAADLTRELAEELGAVAVLSRFSRLLADPNRPEDSPELFRARAEGREVELNRHLDADERERRLARLHRPYHAAIDRALGPARAPVLLAIHTFTPVYEGARRTVEVGVLYDHEEALALRLRAALAEAGLDARLNEPYSGKLGLMYAVERHASAHGRRALELEVRQDLVMEPEVRRRVRSAILRVLAGV